LIALGFGLPMAGPWATPDSLVQVAQGAEALGYRSLWTFQRLLYPAAPRNQYYGATGTAWPEAFRSVIDPLIALGFVAAVTSRIRLGVSVLIMPFYTPLVLAKQLATLDVVSRGRLEVGLGIGWSIDELEAAGGGMAARGARADEFLECLTALWTLDEVEFRGRYYAIPRTRFEPKPVQRPHPPVLIGGYSDAVFRRVARFGDGYAGGNVPFDEMARVVERVRAAAVAAGRRPDALRIVCRGSFNLTDAAQPGGRRALWGSAEQIREDIGRYAACGVTELFLEPNFQPGGATLARALAQMEALAPGR
jgi:probable F420-dependent oxidoreductase